MKVTHLPRLAGRGLIKAYRYTLSPLVGFHCRHLPTCSEYADEALDRYGLWAGGWMTLARLTRCQPWGTSGIDRVPEGVPDARWYAPWRYGKWSWRNDSETPSAHSGESGNPALGPGSPLARGRAEKD
ncbi:MAG TPA: membrane protein insertion efficiency factor YidD [Xanthobacteraceae bacterium]|nr:membrane protein insertion efficiency factor YidD [Xanthobacteraceae bacterium]